MQAPKKEIFSQLARIGTAISSEVRLEILELLAQSERRVEELAELTQQSVANVSQHLQKLRQAGLVLGRKQGQQVHYRLAGDAVGGLLTALARVAGAHNAEVERVLRAYYFSKDDMEPVDRRELLERARRGLVVVLDVRPPEEYAAGHVPGAVNIPIEQLPRRMRELPRSKQVVAYCRGAYCLMSFEAVELLRRKGLRAARMADGLPEWRADGLPVEGP